MNLRKWAMKLTVRFTDPPRCACRVVLLGALLRMRIADRHRYRAPWLRPNWHRQDSGIFPRAATACPNWRRMTRLPPDLLVHGRDVGRRQTIGLVGYGALKGMRTVRCRSRWPAAVAEQVIVRSPACRAAAFRRRITACIASDIREFAGDFLYQDTESYIWGIYLLPWNWTWLSDPLVGTNDFMERVYNRTMFHGATFADLAKRGRPVIAIGATDIAYGNRCCSRRNLRSDLLRSLRSSRWRAPSRHRTDFPGCFRQSR